MLSYLILPSCLWEALQKKKLKLMLLCMYMRVSHFSHVWLFANPWTIAHQAPLSKGILQAGILEWVAMPSSFRRSSHLRDWIQVSRMAVRFFYHLSQQASPRILKQIAYHFSRDLPNAGIKWGSPAFQADSLPAELSGKPPSLLKCLLIRKDFPVHFIC